MKQTTPKLKITSSTAKIGVNYVRDVVERSNCIFQKIDQENDLGIDGLIELIKEEMPINKQLAVQVKSGESYFNIKSNECRIPIENHRLYWSKHPLPVYGVVYVPSLETAYSINIKEYLNEYPNSTIIKFVASDSNEFCTDKFLSLFIPRLLGQVAEISFETALTYFRSGNREEFFIGLTVLFRKHINNINVWDELIEYFKKTSTTDIPAILIYYFAHIPWHGDIWGIGEMPTKGTKDYVQKIFNQFKKVELVKLLSVVDEEGMISRGTVGQSVEAIISSLENCENLLNSIITDKTVLFHIREVAVTIFAMNWPDTSVKQLKALAKEGSWYSDELLKHIQEWGGYNPYA